MKKKTSEQNENQEYIGKVFNSKYFLFLFYRLSIYFFLPLNRRDDIMAGCSAPHRRLLVVCLSKETTKRKLSFQRLFYI